MPNPNPPIDISHNSGKISAVLQMIQKGVDWANCDFSYPKAYICSILSQWAYGKLTPEEKGASISKRIRILNFPLSVIHGQLILQQRAFVFEEFIDELRLGAEGREQIRVELLDIHVDQFVVAIVIRLQGIIFIAIRGTHDLFDLIVDANIAKFSPPWGFMRYYYHVGFYTTISKCFNKLRKIIQAQAQAGQLIYVTGHSLGGALSGVLCGAWNQSRNYPHIHSAYAFGMPRYGNRRVMSVLDAPYVILNPDDIIPELVEAGLGYANAPHEYSSVASQQVLNRTGWSNVGHYTFPEKLALLKKHLPDHGIENYITTIERFV